ncbi:23S rRNA (cytidine1920-2'-O)/16S rRNA (cytidine1409-2'-O)-methyltransferase [Frondihabitans sp. PhB188]|uniref:TlyA family RNA methyltransferase n=1 Tax=Frondihabitans sp. PhB188 TaxID=2485200 RepID=UPI000F4ACBC5|nr:TlyA family RNA methyltransferase [Frondihabitans sp. PhB188]ROQ40647.1 23S rRNA (cytidine1920-2'-O)/16S rRNA (cytidine1409-2'-O)-methyltransferase [Frondihabitans sp. PhB188]
MTPATEPEAALSGPERLDVALTSRGLARSRTHAHRMLADGLVTVDGKPVLKASFSTLPVQRIEVAGLDHYVSRAAHKLIGALDAFDVDPAGRDALDVGASTGGFTQVLLERGIRSVVALDVGHGQLVPRIRGDDRVAVVEGSNARYLTRDALVASGPHASTIDLVVGDLSFISLGLVLPALVSSVAPASDFVLLVKPQFEVGRQGIREGIVHDAALRSDAVQSVLWSAHDLGLRTAGVIPSPIVGTNGNREYCVHLSAAAGVNPTEWIQRVDEMTKG